MKVLICVISLILLAQQSLFEQLSEKCDLKKHEFLVVTFQTPSSCVKCFIEPMKIIEIIKNESSDKPLKIIALVRVDREIELKVFQRENDWKYPMFVDDGNARKQLGIKGTSMIAILNAKGKIVEEFALGNMKENIEKAKKFAKK